MTFIRLPCAGVILVICVASAIEEKVSDACHGLGIKAYNVLNCSAGLTVNVTEVRYYQWKPECWFEISHLPATPNCCVHDNNDCSWTNETETTRFKHFCMGKMMCSLHSASALPVVDACRSRRKYFLSSVRSIRYYCVQNEWMENITTSSVVEQSTQYSKVSSGDEWNNTTRGMTSANKDPNGRGLIVGPIVGVLITCGVVIFAVVFLKRRAKSKRQESQIHLSSTQVAETHQRNISFQTYDNTFSETSHQTYTNGGHMSLQVFPTGDDISVEYATVNKPSTFPGVYDNPESFQPCADFQPNVIYSHHIGETEPYNDTYDQTASSPANQLTISSEPEYQVVNPTYDKLSKGNVRVASKSNFDEYNVLEKRTV